MLVADKGQEKNKHSFIKVNNHFDNFRINRYYYVNVGFSLKSQIYDTLRNNSPWHKLNLSQDSKVFCASKVLFNSFQLKLSKRNSTEREKWKICSMKKIPPPPPYTQKHTNTHTLQSVFCPLGCWTEILLIIWSTKVCVMTLLFFVLA